MEERVIDYQPYRGEVTPEGDGTVNLGALWSIWLSERKLLQAELEGRNGQTTAVSAYRRGHEIARGRHHRMVNNYVPRFQKKTCQTSGLLGKGSYGYVWKASFPRVENVALKQISTKSHPEDIWKERDMLIFLKHKRVVNIVGAFYGGDAFLATELCCFSLHQKLRDLNLENKSRFSIQLLEAIQWIHSKQIIHNDLKTDNILVTLSNNLVLSDFGQAIKLEHDFDIIKCDRYRGVLGYSDYEVIDKMLYSKKSDVFAAGCLLYEIWMGAPLLRYLYDFSANPQAEIDEYKKAFEAGRIKGISQLKYEDFETAEREELAKRVESSSFAFQSIVSQMIAPRKGRITAEDIMATALLKHERLNLRAQGWNLDNGKMYVAKDVVFVNQNEMHKFTSYGSIQECAAFSGFYYDEEEMMVTPDPWVGKSLLNYETHVIANFLQESGLVGDLISGLCNKSPTEMAQTRAKILRGLTAGFLGRTMDFTAGADDGASQQEKREVAPVNASIMVAAVGGDEAQKTSIDGREPSPIRINVQQRSLTSTLEEPNSQDVTTVPESQPLQESQMAAVQVTRAVNEPLKVIQVTPHVLVCPSTNGAGGNMPDNIKTATVQGPAQQPPPLVPTIQMPPPPAPSRRDSIKAPFTQATPTKPNRAPSNPPSMTPAQGGVVPDPTYGVYMGAPVFPPNKEPIMLTPSGRHISNIRPKTLTLRGDGLETLARIQALNAGNTFQRYAPPPPPPRSKSTAGVAPRPHYIRLGDRPIYPEDQRTINVGRKWKSHYLNVSKQSTGADSSAPSDSIVDERAPCSSKDSANKKVSSTAVNKSNKTAEGGKKNEKEKTKKKNVDDDDDDDDDDDELRPIKRKHSEIQSSTSSSDNSDDDKKPKRKVTKIPRVAQKDDETMQSTKKILPRRPVVVIERLNITPDSSSDEEMKPIRVSRNKIQLKKTGSDKGKGEKGSVQSNEKNEAPATRSPPSQSRLSPVASTSAGVAKITPKKAQKNTSNTPEKTKDGKIKCTQKNCAGTFSRMSCLRRHLQTIHRIVEDGKTFQKFRCPKKGCNKKYMREDYLKQHIRVNHGPPEEHPCKKCKKVFGNAKALKQHMSKSCKSAQNVSPLEESEPEEKRGGSSDGDNESSDKE